MASSLRAYAYAYTPWEKVTLDCIGPFTIKVIESKKVIEYKLKLLSLIDVGKNWPESALLVNGIAKEAAETFDIEYLHRYPRPRKYGYDNGSEFIGW